MHVENPSGLKFGEPFKMSDVHVALGPEQIDEAIAIAPAPAKTEDEAWVEAALDVWYQGRWDGSRLQNDGELSSLLRKEMRATIVAANLARFGGDPGKKIAELEAQKCSASVFNDRWAKEALEFRDRIAELEATLQHIASGKLYNINEAEMRSLAALQPKGSETQ